MIQNHCPICHSPVHEAGPVADRDVYYINCFRCGEYQITGEAEAMLGNGYKAKSTVVANFCGWIRENQRYMIRSEDLDRLLSLSTPALGDKSVKLLRYFSKQYPLPGLSIDLYPTHNLVSHLSAIESDTIKDIQGEVLDEMRRALPLLAISWSQEKTDFDYLLINYMHHTMKHIKISSRDSAEITPEGWAFLESLRYANPESQSAFIAMWFEEGMNKVYDEAIKSAVIKAGYEPIRIDRTEHVNRIDDEIITRIRQSKFIVADFTGQRGGVYFESGFAQGLGLPVIWLCKKPTSKDEEPHFDVNHFNFIFWEEDELDQLRVALSNRIVSVLGKGPYTPQSN